MIAVDVNTLDLKSTDSAFRIAHGLDDTLPQPQARLLMFPARPAGSAGTVLPAELAWVEVPAQESPSPQREGSPYDPDREGSRSSL